MDSLSTSTSIPSQAIDIFHERLDSRWEAKGRTSAAADLIRESPCGEPAACACEVRFFTTSRRGGLSRKDPRDSGATTAAICQVGRGRTLGTTATGSVTGGAGTRMRSRGCLLFLLLTLAVDDTSRATEG